MELTIFTDAEVERFVSLFEAMPAWTAWRQRAGKDGGGVIEVDVDARKPVTLKLAKTQDDHYMAAGLDGWGLTVCGSFEELLDVLDNMTGEVRRAA